MAVDELADLHSEMQTGFAQSAAGQQQIIGMLSTLIEKDRPDGD